MISSLASCRSRFTYLTHDHSPAIYYVHGSHITSTLWEHREQTSRIQKWLFQEDEIIF